MQNGDRQVEAIANRIDAMWCHGCRADVAAEVSTSTGRASCGRCGDDLGPVRRPVTEQARDLLKQWSAAVDLEEPAGRSRVERASAASAANDAAPAFDSIRRPLLERPWETSAESADAERLHNEPSLDEHRDDGESPAHPAVVPMPVSNADSSPQITRIDAAHTSTPAPHYDVAVAIEARQNRSGTASHVFGQMLAYAGVLALTTGAALVIWSYFGDKPDYAPTGWLVASGGQMLLFLGMVTIVAGGIEQTNREIRAGLGSLSERLVRIEQLVSEVSRRQTEYADGKPFERTVEPSRKRA